MLCKMSKREIFSQIHKDNKRPKLDLSIAEQNFAGNEHQSESKWGDDIEDEVLLIASQACEASFSSKNSTLPGYSICMQPKLTSTQICQPQISGKNEFPFKIPTHTNANNVTVESSVASNFTNKKNNHVDFKGKTLDELRSYISQLQDENSKLISENIDITNKYRSKEGETKILRDNLLSHKKSVENLKLEQVQAQEEIQRQFNEKLADVNSEVESLKAQLDSKNLEIMNLKKWRALDSHNVKVTHVTLSANETMPRHLYQHSDPKKSVNDSGIQTDLKSDMLHLKKPLRIGENKLMEILPLILEDPSDEMLNLLDNNEKLQKQIDFAQSKCRIFNTIHRFPLTSVTAHKVSKPKLNLSCLYQNLAYIVQMGQNCFNEDIQLKYVTVYKQIKLFLSEVLLQLETLEQRMTIAFQKETDQEYIDATAAYIPITRMDLLQAKALCKDEQAVSARRATAVLSYILENSEINKFFLHIEKISGDSNDQLLNLLCKICNLIDTCSCAVLYNGMLVSIILIIKNIWNVSPEAYAKVMNIVRSIVTSRPMYVVIFHLLNLVTNMSTSKDFLKSICNDNHVPKLRLDNDQGVLLYKRDTCVLQLLSKQTECALKCLARQELTNEMVITMQCIISLYNNVWMNDGDHKNRCDCSLIIRQVLVYGLNLCATALKRQHSNLTIDTKIELKALCRCGINLLYLWVLNDINFISRLSYHEGFYQSFVSSCHEMKSDLKLNEMQTVLLAGLEDTLPIVADNVQTPSAAVRDIWIHGFENFNLTEYHS